MRDVAVKSYSPAFPLGSVINNNSIVQVLKSDTPDFKAGDILRGMIGNEEYSVVTKEAAAGLKKVDNPYNLDLKIFIGSLGMPGLTAYASLYDIGKPVKGETIFISAASGAVGQLVGQLAKHEGLRVLGSVGSDEKLDYIIKDLKFDGGFNYKKEKASDALNRLAPDGIDIYYENVSLHLLLRFFSSDCIIGWR
jgi:NADPH-dependent curcumin reductase CurA